MKKIKIRAKTVAPRLVGGRVKIFVTDLRFNLSSQVKSNQFLFWLFQWLILNAIIISDNLINDRCIPEMTVPCLRADGADRCSIALN